MDTPDKPVLLPVLRKARKVVVTCHVSPDGDSVAAMAALSSSLRLARWESVAVSPGPVPEVYQFVPGSDSILVYDPNTGDEPTRSEASRALEQADVIVCVDASDLGRMGEIFEDFRAKFESVPVINIDHHPSNSRFGVLNVVDPSAAAVCELLAVLMEREDMPITEDVASALLVGIVSDSLGFRTPSTTSQTLRVAAALMERGASLSKTTEKIFNTRTLRAMRLWGLVLGRTRVEGGLVWADITPDILRDAGASMEDADNLVDFIAGVPQAAGAFLFSENGGSVKVSIRSSGDLDAAALAAAFGGGGHLRAAGCTLEGSMAQVQERVLAEARRQRSLGKNDGPRIEGFLNVFKPRDWTSHDVVQVVRRLAGVRRVGHGGTLDPAATGVLLVAVGRATRFIDYLVVMDKLYEAEVCLGVATDTDDAEGEVLCSRDPSHLTLDDVTRALGSFLGRVEQIPPQFSAVKLSGRKAYELARKGERAEMAPRTVEIKGMAVIGWEPPLLSLLVLCSKGTYIRSIARDLGERLGVGGHLTRLVRQSVGPFTAARALTIDQLRAAAESGDMGRQLLPPDWAVSHLPSLVVPEEKARDMAIGRPWVVDPSFHGEGRARVYTRQGQFLGLVDRDGEMWQPKLVLAEEPVTDREKTAK